MELTQVIINIGKMILMCLVNVIALLAIAGLASSSITSLKISKLLSFILAICCGIVVMALYYAYDYAGLF